MKKDTHTTIHRPILIPVSTSQVFRVLAAAAGEPLAPAAAPPAAAAAGEAGVQSALKETWDPQDTFVPERADWCNGHSVGALHSQSKQGGRASEQGRRT